MNAPAHRAATRRTLRRALGVILPTDAETQFLRCVLHDGEAGRRAWDDWRHIVGNPMTAFRGERLGQKSLLPLLHVAIARNELDPPPVVARWLSAAYLREQLRGNAYRRILDETLAAIGEVAPPPIVLKGSALASTVYPEPGTRHSHGIELLVREADLPVVTARLPAAGFTAVRRNKARPGLRQLSWRHAAGLPLQLRTRLFDVARHSGGIDAVWQGSRELPGYAARQLAPEHALLHVCGHAAMSGSRVSLRWACDAWFLLRAGSAFDWTRFVDHVSNARLGLSLAGVLHYLADALQVTIPSSERGRIDALADATDDVGHEVAAMGALVASHARMRRVIASGPDWRSRFVLARTLLAPSPACVREMGWVASGALLPIYYLRRPLEYATLRVARTLARWSPTLARGLGAP